MTRYALLWLLALLAPLSARAAERLSGTPFGWGSYDNTATPASWTNLIAIDAAHNYTLGLTADGTVVAAGRDVPPGLTNVTAISAGYHFGLALRADGHVVAWGGDGHVATAAIVTPPEWLTNVVAIAAGYDHSLALTSDGYLVAWGWNGLGVLTTPLDITHPRWITSGQQFCVVVRGDGRLAGWGDNYYRELSFPVALTNAVQVDAGPFQHVVGLRDDGRVFAWGNSEQGKIAVPPDLTNVVQVAAGSFHSLALKADGTVAAWGGNRAEFAQPPVNAPRFFAVAAGDQHSVGLTRGPVPHSPAYSLFSQAGATAELTASFLSATPYTVSWRQNGQELPGATGPTLSLTNVQSRHAGDYTLVASNEFGVVASAPITLHVALMPPSVSRPPRPLAVPAGSEAVFTVDAGGSEPLQYQWQFNGADLPGETNADLHLPAVGPAQDGDYRVVVSNAQGTVTSTSAPLSTGLARFLERPRSLILRPGMEARFSAAVLTPETPALQWWFNGRPLPGETGAELRRPDMSAALVGAYYLVAGNSFGAVTSRVAQLDLRVLPAPAGEPATVVGWGGGIYGPLPVPDDLTNAVAIAAGGAHGLALRADGRVAVWTTPGLGFEADLAPPAGLDHVTAVAAGFNHCLALKADGTVVGWGRQDAEAYGQAVVPPGLDQVVAIAAGREHSLAVRQDGALVCWPDPSRLPPGLDQVVDIAVEDSLNLALRADGSIWLWTQNDPGSPVVFPDEDAVQFAAGAEYGALLRRDGTIARLNRQGTEALPPPADPKADPVLEIDAGQVAVVARTASGKTWGYDGGFPLWAAQQSGLIHPTRLTIGYLDILAMTPAPFITQQPQGINARAGSPVRLAVLARSSSPLRFQWRRNGRELPGETNAALEFPVVHFDDASVYDVVLANGRDQAVSAASTVSVFGPPEVAGPADQTVKAGADVQFHVTATGPGPYGYQWLYNLRPIPGATNASLSLTNVQAAAAGDYAVEVSNGFGPARSRAAHLSVEPAAPEFSGMLAPQSLPEGARLTMAALAHGTEPLAYQWSFAGKALPGETRPDLSRAAVTVSDGGDYELVVRNLIGSATNAVRITVTPSAPFFGGLPDWRLANAGQTFTFAPAVIGTRPLAYQWFFAGEALPGATNAALILTDVRANDAGHYQLAVTNALGSAVSGTMALVVIPGGGPGAVVGWGATLVPDEVGLVQAVSAGRYHTLAVGLDGVVQAWGNNDFGQATLPAGLSNVVAVAAGVGFSAALRSDGSVVAWGDGRAGQTNVPASLAHVIALAAGTAHILALRDDGTVTGWGSSQNGVLNFPAGLTNLTAVAANGFASAALRTDGQVLAWGADAPAVPANSATNLAAVAVGQRFVLGLDRSGRALRWGSTLPVLSADATNLMAIAAGSGHGLGLRSNRTVLTWGSNLFGERNVPSGLGQVTAVFAGGYYSLAMTRSPVVTQPPVSGTALLGQDARLQVGVTGLPPLLYQWLHDGMELAGETNATLQLPHVAFSADGNYTVRVANPWQTIESGPATVTIVGPIDFRITRREAGALTFFARMPGAAVAQLEGSPDLQHWSLRQTFSLPTEGTTISIPVEEGQDGSFYRLRLP